DGEDTAHHGGEGDRAPPHGVVGPGVHPPHGEPDRARHEEWCEDCREQSPQAQVAVGGQRLGTRPPAAPGGGLGGCSEDVHGGGRVPATAAVYRTSEISGPRRSLSRPPAKREVGAEPVPAWSCFTPSGTIFALSGSFSTIGSRG